MVVWLKYSQLLLVKWLKLSAYVMVKLLKQLKAVVKIVS